MCLLVSVGCSLPVTRRPWAGRKAWFQLTASYSIRDSCFAAKPEQSTTQKEVNMASHLTKEEYWWTSIMSVISQWPSLRRVCSERIYSLYNESKAGHMWLLQLRGHRQRLILLTTIRHLFTYKRVEIAEVEWNSTQSAFTIVPCHDVMHLTGYAPSSGREYTSELFECSPADWYIRRLGS